MSSARRRAIKRLGSALDGFGGVLRAHYADPSARWAVDEIERRVGVVGRYVAEVAQKTRREPVTQALCALVERWSRQEYYDATTRYGRPRHMDD